MVIHIPLSKQGKHKGKYITIVDDCDSDLAELRWSVLASQYCTSYATRKVKGEEYNFIDLFLNAC